MNSISHQKFLQRGKIQRIAVGKIVNVSRRKIILVKAEVERWWLDFRFYDRNRLQVRRFIAVAIAASLCAVSLLVHKDKRGSNYVGLLINCHFTRDCNWSTCRAVDLQLAHPSSEVWSVITWPTYCWMTTLTAVATSAYVRFERHVTACSHVIDVIEPSATMRTNLSRQPKTARTVEALLSRPNLFLERFELLRLCL